MARTKATVGSNHKKVGSRRAAKPTSHGNQENSVAPINNDQPKIVDQDLTDLMDLSKETRNGDLSSKVRKATARSKTVAQGPTDPMGRSSNAHHNKVVHNPAAGEACRSVDHKIGDRGQTGRMDRRRKVNII